MNIIVWIVQGFLAAIFLMAGVMKTTQPVDKLVKSITWTGRFQLSTIRFIGIMEILGATGIIIPWALNILPVLTPIAATGLALIQFLAILHHSSFKEIRTIVINILLLLLSAFVANVRFGML
jgi:uncharacterized membrane protein YphA (DoxX/SURF4 family)